eukprot:1996298-Amphidinium_carterae.1
MAYCRKASLERSCASSIEALQLIPGEFQVTVTYFARDVYNNFNTDVDDIAMICEVSAKTDPIRLTESTAQSWREDLVSFCDE